MCILVLVLFNDDRGFNLESCLYWLSGMLCLTGLQLKAVLDFGQSKDVNDHQRIGYVKNAQITWKQKRLDAECRIDFYYSV